MIQQIGLVVLVLHAAGKWPKRRGKDDRESKVRSTCFAHFWLLPSQGRWCLWALADRCKPPTKFPFWGLPSVMQRQSRAHHLLCAGHVIHSHKHIVELVKQKTCIPSKQRELSVFLPCPEDPGQAPEMTAYSERCQIRDLQRRFNFWTRDQA